MSDPRVVTIAAAGTPVLAFGGALAGRWLSRKGVKEQAWRWSEAVPAVVAIANAKRKVTAD